ncbi:MAG: hypothetical protein J1F03_00715 [Oscillospiraceae bacterium]|nr:hypothetical protein [Oscillospiraceae bacterium]
MKRISVRRILSAALPIAVFMIMIVWLVSGVLNANSAVDANELEEIKKTIENGVTICYAIEGVYPESIDYLKENYGVVIDSSKYIVHYESIAANIRPTITIIERW